MLWSLAREGRKDNVSVLHCTHATGRDLRPDKPALIGLKAHYFRRFVSQATVIRQPNTSVWALELGIVGIRARNYWNQIQQFAIMS